MSIIDLSHLFSTLYAGLKLGKEPPRSQADVGAAFSVMGGVKDLTLHPRVLSPFSLSESDILFPVGRYGAIGLALLAAIGSTEPTWDRVLLTAVPA